MRTLLLLLSALALAAPVALDSGTAEASWSQAAPEDGRIAKKDKKKKKKKKKKGQEEETPPPPPPDSDGDSVIDTEDGCPEDPEDEDGFEDEDGCPDPDNDGDEIADVEDDCPDEAENKDGWADTDGCPEGDAKIEAFGIDAVLVDGTKVKGKVVRIVALDEDAKDAKPFEPETIAVITADEHEMNTPWSNIRSLSAAKVVFGESVDCYSEGVEELGDDRVTWECTLKHPTTFKLAENENKGTTLGNDRKMIRHDLWIDELTCDGDSCEKIEKDRGLSLYFYKVPSQEKSEQEYEAVKAIQDRLREMQKTQLRKATFKAIE